MAARSAALNLYRSFIREAYRYPDYNMKQYIIRRARWGFSTNAAASPSEAAVLLASVHDAQKELDVVRRQSVIAGMYKTDRSIMETGAAEALRR